MVDANESPALREALLRIARKAVQGKPLPVRMKLAPADEPALRLALSRALETEVRVASDGSLYVSFPESRRSPEAWRELACKLHVAQTVAADAEARRAADRRADSTFKRAALLAPDAAHAIRELAENDSVRRFVRQDDASASIFVKLVQGAVQRVGASDPATLSQLGSDWFGDSKILRAGTVRAQLLHVLRALADDDAETGESELFARFGIEENPYTSHVVAFVPFLYFVPDDANGGEEMFDYPWRLFNRREACVLPLETVRRIKRVEILPPHYGPDCRRIVTSENAAPFRGLVSRSIPAVYTEGYPNFAVQRLLRLFAKAGLRAEHAGDGDLDGYRIADLVSSCIPVDRIIADDLRADGLPRRPLSSQARARLEAWLSVHPDSPHVSSLRETLSLGWLEQESFPLPSIP